MNKFSKKLFICFSAKDRYDIVQPVVYHLKNYGIDIWYDRYELLMGDDRYEKNIKEGAEECNYALIILSSNTIGSKCATEEIKVLESRYNSNEVVVFPVLYELKPCNVPSEFAWIKNLIFKEANRTTGTFEICNHIACKVTNDMLSHYNYRTVSDIVNADLPIPKSVCCLLNRYNKIDNQNVNSKITLLYAVYTILKYENITINQLYEIPTKAFERIFNETSLNLAVDYRDIWLLENCLCILINYYVTYCIESKM